MPELVADQPIHEELAEALRTAGNPFMRSDVAAMQDDTVASTARVQQEAVALARRFERELHDRIQYKDDGSGLTKASERKVDAMSRALAKEAAEQFEQRMHREVRRTQTAAAESAANALAQQGWTPPSKSAMDKIAREVANDNSVFFGMTTAQRIAALRDREAARIQSLARGEAKTPGKPDDRAPWVRNTDARQRITDSLVQGVGGLPTSGGSMLKEMQRIQVSEQHRKAFETQRRIGEHAGLQFAYRRLSSRHRRYHRVEICEFLALQEVDGIVQKLIDAGINPANLDLRGLYPIEEMPGYPHPFCQCWCEPLVPPPSPTGVEDIDGTIPGDPVSPVDGPEREQIGLEQAAELLNGTRANAFKIDDGTLARLTPFTQSLNALAETMQLPGVAFTTYDLAVLGVEGATAILRERIRLAGGEALVSQVLNGVQKLQEQSIPAMEAKVQELQDWRARERARIEKDRALILSDTTAASQLENLKARYSTEVRKTQANVATLLTLERVLSEPPRTELTTRSAQTSAEMIQRMTFLGLDRDKYDIVKQAGRYRAVVKGSGTGGLLDHFDRQTQRNERVAEIKSWALQPVDNTGELPAHRRFQGIRARLPGDGPTGNHEGWEFTLDRISGKPAAQAGGVRFLEEAGSALWHFAPGLGKTPAVITSISDLKARGMIENAVIAPPAAVRQQMVVETIKFNEKDKISYYVPRSQVKKSLESIRESLVGDYESSFNVGKKARLLQGLNDEAALLRDRIKVSEPTEQRVLQQRLAEIEKAQAGTQLTAREKLEWADIQKGAQQWAENGMKRVQVIGVTTKTGRDDFEQHVQGAGRGSTFHIMGHDDLARMAPAIRRNVDYVAIDEVHQLTSQGTGPGSKKAQALEELSGGRIKYKVGLTGTAVRNDIGEAHDILSWLRPGMLPDKAEFMRQYGNVTYESDLYRQAGLKVLQTLIDDSTMTMGSPVDAKLLSAFSDRSTPEEQEKQIRRLQMTGTQQRRAGEIEEEFDRLKQKQRHLKGTGDLRQVENALVDARRELENLAAESLGMSVASYRAHLKELPEGAPVPPKPGYSPSPEARARMRELSERVESYTRLTNPESWRDNEHHKNVHGGDWRENAKALEVVRQLTTPTEEGGRAGRPTLIHLERFDSIEMLTEALKAQGLRVADYHGGLGPSERAQRVAEMNDGKLDVLILTRAGSTGLNVQKVSDSTIHFDLPYTFAEVEQRDARNWRNGQKRDVDSLTLLQDDMYTDRRRLELVREKRGVLKAIDEVSKLDDRVDPMQVAREAAKGLRSYADLEVEVGRRRAEAFLVRLCAEMVDAGVTNVTDCPVRPARLQQQAVRDDPIMAALPAEDRKTLRDKRKEGSDGERTP